MLVGLKSLTGMSNCTVLYFAANHSKVEYRTSITDGKSFYQIKINIKSFIFICIKMYLSLQTGRCPPAYRRHIRIIEHASNNKLYNLTIIESPEIVRTYIWRRGRAGRRGPGRYTTHNGRYSRAIYCTLQCSYTLVHKEES